MHAEPRVGAESAGLTPTSNTRSEDQLTADHLESLRVITRKMATAEDLQSVLRSIITAIVEAGHGVDPTRGRMGAAAAHRPEE